MMHAMSKESFLDRDFEYTYIANASNFSYTLSFCRTCNSIMPNRCFFQDKLQR